MARYVEGGDRQQVTLLPECLDDYIAEDNPVRVVDAFVDELDLEALGFARPAGHRARMHSLLVCIARATRLKHMRGRTKRGDHIRQPDYRPSMPTGVPIDED